MKDSHRRTVAKNRKARHEYHILETEDAGLELLGTEVKAIRAGRVNLKEAFVVFEVGEAWLVGCHISPYENAGYARHDPVRKRKLLLHRRQIDRLGSKVQEKGLTVVPLEMFIDGNWIKVTIGLVRGKQLHDKRETLKRRTLDREAEMAIKERE
jgi:SsrA-binding protein